MSEPIDRQRLFDLVRYQRHELFNAELISEDEYASLLIEGAGSVKRLESYDEVRARSKVLEAQLAAERKRFDWVIRECEVRHPKLWEKGDANPDEWREAIDAILEGK